MGSRRTWNALTPTIAPARRSRTYASIPWITATTATRNATETMMPSRVKNERSRWLETVWRARMMASRLFVAERLNGIHPRGATRGIQPETHTGERRREQRRHDRPQRHVRGNGGDGRDEEREQAAAQHADGAAHERERRRLDQELPQDGAARCAQRLAHADLPRPLGHGDHHDRDYANATHDQSDRRQYQHHEEEHAAHLVPRVEQFVLGDEREIVLLAGLESPERAQRRDHLVHGLLLRVSRPRRDGEAHPALEVRHTLHERAVRHVYVGRRGAAEQAQRLCCD